MVFCTILVTIHFSLKRDASAANGFTDLHLLAILQLPEYTLHDISHSVCAKHDKASIVMTVKYRLL